MTRRQTLDWSELEPAARETFRIWMSGTDFEWAKEAWGHLTKAGLCNYETQPERHVVLGRFLALASIYKDWCSVVFDETHGDDHDYWIGELDVEPIYLGQLLANEELSEEPDEALSEGMGILLNRERAAVVGALHGAYGGTDEDFFIALWRSVNTLSGAGFMNLEPDSEDDVDVDYTQILNHLTGNELAGYSWIVDGCPFVRP